MKPEKADWWDKTSATEPVSSIDCFRRTLSSAPPDYYYAHYSGAATFIELEDLVVPKTLNVQSIQLKALRDEDDELLQKLRASDPSTGLDAVTEMRTWVPTESGHEDSNGTVGGTEVMPVGKPNNFDGGNAGEGLREGTAQLRTIIIVAAVIAGISLVILGLALFLSFRRKRRFDMRKEDSSVFNSPSTQSMQGMSSANKKKSFIQRLAVSISNGNLIEGVNSPGTSNQSSSPVSLGGSIGDGSLDHKDHLGLDGDLSSIDTDALQSKGEVSSNSLKKSMFGLYPNTVVTDDIETSIKAYEKFISGYGNTDPTPIKDDQGLEDLNISSPIEMDGHSICSLDSSQYGFSLDGYSITEGSKTGAKE